ncbi:MAG TPA: PEP-utilizing enzyme [Dehalococcoidia bacterium]|nr:PEP-utilizing enzyme [Dehalococcoidia bacterium]
MRVVYKCDDGTDFPVDWDDPADAEMTWGREAEHLKLPSLPIESSTIGPAMGAGASRAFVEVGLPAPPFAGGRVMVANGWVYTTAFGGGDEMGDGMAQMMAGFRGLNEVHGGPVGVWEKLCLPRIKEACEELKTSGGDASPLELATRQWYAWGHTMVAMFASFGPTLALEGFCNQEFGLDGSAFAGELMQGYENATVQADEDLWRVAQVAKGSEAARKALAASPIDVEALKADGGFWRAFQGYLDVYGERTGHWQVGAPTLIEEPETALSLIARMIEAGTSSPLAMLRRAAERREARLQELAQRLGPEKAPQLRRMAAAAAMYSPVREGRAYWQLVAWGRMRLAMFRIGERLVREGRIADAKDVLFLTAEEIEGAGAHDMRAAVAERREAWERSAKLKAPESIGKMGNTLNPFAGTSRAAVEDAADVIRGVAASRGAVTAVARVIESPQEGKRLQPGEVLVCRMTAPPWTPLFAIASAVVTETGGALSHPAIVAREYGIPCVVGAKGATSRIRDGQRITVDGTAGTVTLLKVRVVVSRFGGYGGGL